MFLDFLLGAWPFSYAPISMIDFSDHLILTNLSHVKDPPILTPKQPKVANFDKTDFWGLKYHCLQKGPYFKELVLNKDLFGIFGPYWVLIYISGSLFSLFWFHSRKECQFSLQVYEKLNKSYEAHHL